MEKLELKIGLIDRLSGPARFVKKSLQEVTNAISKTGSKATGSGLGAVVSKLRETGAAATGTATKLKALETAVNGSKVAREFTKITTAAKGAESVLSRMNRKGSFTKSGAGSSVKELAALRQRVAEARSGFSDQRLGMRGLGGMKAGMGARAMGAMAGPAMLAGGAALGGLAYGVAGSVKNRETTTLALGQAWGNGAQQMDDMRAMSVRLGVSLSDLSEQARGLSRAGFGADMSKTLMKQMADMQAFGVTAEETSRAVLAITQIKNAGKLQGDELNQLSEAGIGADAVYSALEKRLGKTRAEVLKMKEAGKIDSDSAIGAIQDAIKQKTGGGAAGALAEKFGDTTSTGAWNKLKATASVALDTISQSAAPAIASITAIMTRMAAFAGSQEGQAVFDGIARGLTVLTESIVGLVGGFQQGGGFDAIGRIFTSLVETIAGPNVQGGLTTSGEAIGRVLGNIAGIIEGLQPVFGLLFALLEALATTVKGVSSALSWVGGGIEKGRSVGSWIDEKTSGLFPHSEAFNAKSKQLGANDSGGLVTGVSGGVATVRAAPGEGLASIGRGERIVPAQGGSGGRSVVVNISPGAFVFNGSEDGKGTMAAIRAAIRQIIEEEVSGAGLA